MLFLPLDSLRSFDEQAPEIVSIYALHIPPSLIRLKIRQDIERNKHIDNLAIINFMLLKNQQEYQETMNCWKQEVCHPTPLAFKGISTPAELNCR